MSNQVRDNFITVGDECLASYVAGGLSAAKRLLIGCQAAIYPKLAAQLSDLDHIGGAVLESAQGEPLSQRFWDQTTDAVDQVQEAAPKKSENGPYVKQSSWIPQPLQRYIEQTVMKLNWRAAGVGVSLAPIYENDTGERLYLLKANEGLKLPIHTHRGEEWTLLLRGGYHVGNQSYRAGDLHVEDENCTHQPIIDDGAACISLVAIEGKLKFPNPVLKIVQPFFGV